METDKENKTNPNQDNQNSFFSRFASHETISCDVVYWKKFLRWALQIVVCRKDQVIVKTFFGAMLHPNCQKSSFVMAEKTYQWLRRTGRGRKTKYPTKDNTNNCFMECCFQYPFHKIFTNFLLDIRQALIYRKFCKATFAGYYHEWIHCVLHHVSLLPFPVCFHVSVVTARGQYHTLTHILLSLKCSLYCQAETNFSWSDCWHVKMKRQKPETRDKTLDLLILHAKCKVKFVYRYICFTRSGESVSWDNKF